MAQKKLMLLGGIRYLVPAIEAAHKHGHHVITVDYLPDNIAHKYSDEYHDVSILEKDKDKVLKLAQELQIDGILSYAVDPGVVAASYVAEKMGLPFTCSYESAGIMQDKSKFRQFLTEHGFNVLFTKHFHRHYYLILIGTLTMRHEVVEASIHQKVICSLSDQHFTSNLKISKPTVGIHSHIILLLYQG